MIQPVEGKLNYNGIISQKFGECATPRLCEFYNGLGLIAHNGIDFRGNRKLFPPDGRGTPIYAALGDRVILARKLSGSAGNTIIILSDNYIATQYLHLEKILVKEGDKVQPGQQIATMGNSGSSRGFYMAVHLHFGLYKYAPAVPNTYQRCYPNKKCYTVLNANNGYRGAINSLPYLLKSMRYIINKKNEQFLLEETLKLAINIADPEELLKLKVRGLKEEPEKAEVPKDYLIYPGVEQSRLRDLLGL